MTNPRPSAQRVLVIPDIHQDVAWAQRVLAAAGPVDQVVLLGDYFDPNDRDAASVAETCAFLLGLRETYGARVVFLLGNHDVQYLEAKPWCDRHTRGRHLKYSCGSAFSQSRARKIAKLLPVEFWHDARLFAMTHGWLLSHAGVSARYWPAGTPDEALASLATRSRQVLANLRGIAEPLLLPGTCRGGDQSVGGIIWQDWDEEFEDAAIPFPQIVGHTSNPIGARQKGRSWCIDGRQSTFGILSETELSIHQA